MWLTCVTLRLPLFLAMLHLSAYLTVIPPFLLMKLVQANFIIIRVRDKQIANLSPWQDAHG